MNRSRKFARILSPGVAVVVAAPAFAHVDPSHGVPGLFGALPHMHDASLSALLPVLPYAASFLLTACLLLATRHIARKSRKNSL